MNVLTRFYLLAVSGLFSVIWFRGTSVWVPRRKTPVKIKSVGAVDIHFHGAFGIDLMKATPSELDQLSLQLGTLGIAAFCPTTLSMPLTDLRRSLQTLGRWTQERKQSRLAHAALPLGIHLEGPYLSPGACGAHAPESLRKFSLAELEALWLDSQKQLKIITLAPELVSVDQRRKLAVWAKDRGITLSAGHSRALVSVARQAFAHGFTGVTHAWNASGFHQRSPGVLGAALGRPNVYVELILDQVHVAPEVLRWTSLLHGPNLCYVSDCAPAAATRPDRYHTFGNLKVRFKEGACRLASGELAGGGVLLPQAFAQWIQDEAQRLEQDPARLLKTQLPCLNTRPLQYLSLEARPLDLLRGAWQIDPSGKIRFVVDGSSQDR